MKEIVEYLGVSRDLFLKICMLWNCKIIGTIPSAQKNRKRANGGKYLQEN